MIAGNVFAAEFPRSRIKISNVDHVASGITDLYAITYSERLPNGIHIQAMKLSSAFAQQGR